MQVSLLLVFVLLFQAAPVNTPTDGLALLRDVTQRYSDAKSYHIEATAEFLSHNDLSRNWQKTLLKAIVAPVNRYRYEGRSGSGSTIRVSNGTKLWNYHLDELRYTEEGVSTNDSDEGRVMRQEEMAAMEAKDLISRIRTLATPLKSAKLLPDETLVINGQRIDCYVIRFTEADSKTHKPDITWKETVWVDKSRRVIVKTIRQSNTYPIIAGSKAHIPMVVESTTTFDVVRLDEPEPESSFIFTPPPDAKLVASFPDPFAEYSAIRTTDFVGKPAPDLRFARDGKEVSLASFRGKPVFIEFWASWCVPCVELTPELKQLYTDTASKGLVWLTFDSDEDPSVAETFIKQEHIPWSNYHDTDGKIGKAFGREAIPLGVLIDAEGKVTFYKSGYEMSKLRAAIAKLSTDFSSVAPKPEQKTDAGAKSQP